MGWGLGPNNQIWKLFGLGLLLMAWSPIVVAQTDSNQTAFKRAKNAYSYGNYGDAIRRFRQLLYPLPGKLRSPFLRKEAHKYLGLSYYYLYLRTRKNRFKRSSERELTLFLLQSPNSTLDPLLYPPNLISFFNRVRRKNKQRLEKLRRQRKKRRKVTPIQVIPLQFDKTVFKYSPWLALIPFGAPQFITRQNAKGGLLAVGQSLALIVNITSYLSILDLQIKNDKFNLGRFKKEDIPTATAWQITQGVSLAVFGALVLYGVIDGFVVLSKRNVTILPALPNINKQDLSLPRPPLSPSFSIPAQ